MKIKTLIDKNELNKRIIELSETINSAYDNNRTLNLICILKGAVMFFCELSKHLKMPVKMHFICLSSWGDKMKSSGEVKFENSDIANLEGSVLIIEDIIDSGLTLITLSEYIKKNYSVDDLKIAVLFDKKCARKYNISPDFSAFEVDDKFILGFGLDYQGLYRNLDYVGYIEN